MKLCRFELKAEPGSVRSGIVYAGKVYETDGANPIGIHEAADVRPLAPIPTPPSMRIFPVSALENLSEEEDLPFFYANPASITGPSQVINAPIVDASLRVETYFCAVMVDGGYQISEEEVDGFILGYTLVNALVSASAQRQDARFGLIGRSHDLGMNLGPVITTPDEVEDALVEGEDAPKFKLTAIGRINGVDKETISLADLPSSLHQAIVSASRSCTLRAGDLIAIGPLFDPETTAVTPDDEFQVSAERLGTLSTKIGLDSEN